FPTLYSVLPDLPSFPTRRSSDLERPFQHPLFPEDFPGFVAVEPGDKREFQRADDEIAFPFGEHVALVAGHAGRRDRGVPVEQRRSEEHTSELQSREKLVCRLLLE